MATNFQVRWISDTESTHYLIFRIPCWRVAYHWRRNEWNSKIDFIIFKEIWYL